MGTPRVENTFVGNSVGELQPSREEKVEVQNAPLVEARRKAEFKTAIQASTARILELALTCGDLDSDPEAA